MDADVFQGDKSPALTLAEEISEFVRRSRKAAADGNRRQSFWQSAVLKMPKPRTTVNPHFHHNFAGILLMPTKAAKSECWNAEYVDLILREVHLDMAELSDGST